MWKKARPNNVFVHNNIVNENHVESLLGAITSLSLPPDPLCVPLSISLLDLPSWSLLSIVLLVFFLGCFLMVVGFLVLFLLLLFPTSSCDFPTTFFLLPYFTTWFYFLFSFCLVRESNNKKSKKKKKKIKIIPLPILLLLLSQSPSYFHQKVIFFPTLLFQIDFSVANFLTFFSQLPNSQFSTFF